MISNIEGIEVYYEEHGAGTPVLMLHGYSLDHRVLKCCMEPIFQNRSGFRRIYFDLPGMGRTKSSPQIKSSNEMLDIVSKFLEERIPKGPFLISGLSYGGYLARALCAKYLERIMGLCLIVPLIVPDPKKRALPKRSILKEDPELWKSMTPEQKEEFKKIAVIATKQTWDQYLSVIVPGVKRGDKPFLDKFFATGYPLSWGVDDVVKPYEFPTLIITGKFDDSVGYRDAWSILENFSRGSFVVLDEAGHMLPIEKEELFVGLVDEWIGRCNIGTST
jgi:pimeloyl-ACP methyl ester carboxylesterase